MGTTEAGLKDAFYFVFRISGCGGGIVVGCSVSEGGLMSSG